MLTFLATLVPWPARAAEGPTSQPASDKPDRTVIIERHFWPQRELDEAYQRGLREGYAQGRLDATYGVRTERLLGTRDQAMQAGLKVFAQGRYDEAADYFLLATELDHGDPASRIHAAQALFALQQYDRAAQLVRRAFELQPRLLYLKFDLRKDYGDPGALADQLQAFRQFLADRPDWQDGQLLLGYQLLYSGQRAEAHAVLSVAVRLNTSDKLAARLHMASVPLPPTQLPNAYPRPPRPVPSTTPPGGSGHQQHSSRQTNVRPISPATPAARA